MRSLWLVALGVALTACPAVIGENDAGGGGGGTGGSGGGTGGGGFTGPGLDSRPSNTTCVGRALPTTGGVTTQRVFANLSFAAPMGMMQAPGDTARVFVMERDGVIRVFPNVQTAMPGDVTTFLDFSGRVDTQGEGGFLGMAFHPAWPATPEVYVSYTETAAGQFRSVISRFKSTNGGMTLDDMSEERLLLLNQPFSNHNGGNIAFGPDGFLYIGFGDGGSGGDPNNAGQSLNTNHGKFLRIDVNVPFAQRYAIPPSNPFAGDNTPCNLGTAQRQASDAGVRCSEIYATGFRNPWRWSFDTGSADLWVADVGQGAWEEVNLVTLGGNYGWRFREGAHCYNPGTNCPTANLIDPVVEYDRSLGNSITGGFVYRGTRVPSLTGQFVFGDYGSGRVFSVEPDGMGGSRLRQLIDTSFSIASFGQLHDGEVYILDIASGRVHQLIAASMDAGMTWPPPLLSQTGCVSSADVKQPASGLVPYDLNAPFWSDGAVKERFMAIPDGTTVTVQSNGDFDFPDGTVLVKNFTLAGRRIETRLFVKHTGGTWQGYSYEWNDQETEATLLTTALDKTFGAQTWHYPSRGQCLQCHTAQAGRSLGPELGQFNRDFAYPAPGRTANQLTTLSSIGYFSAALPGTLPRYEPPFGSGPLEERARAYLHSNCAGCHQQGLAPGPADWRHSLSFAQTGACNATPTQGNLGVANARLITPGAPATSLVSLRMKAAQGMGRMPPVGSTVVDTAGAALIDEWITSLSACP